MRSAVIERLLAAGADANAKNEIGKTAFDNALEKNDEPSAELLAKAPSNGFVLIISGVQGLGSSLGEVA